MPFHVVWEVDIEDDDAIQTPEQAAQKAIELMADVEANQRVFFVTNYDMPGEVVRVDLGG